MFLKKIPPINIVLFVVMLGIVAAATIGVIKYIESTDDVDNNYVENSYNATLSNHYTDSLSRTPLNELGQIEIRIYDSIENMHKSFVICKIKNNHEAFTYYEVKKRSITTLLPLFYNEIWNGEITYSISELTSWRSSTFPIHPKQLEILNESENPWD